MLLNDLNGSMKLPRKYRPENCFGIFSHENPSNEYCPIRKPPYGNSSGNICFATNEKTECL